MSTPCSSSGHLVENHSNGNQDRVCESHGSIKLIDGGFATQLSCHVQDQIDGDVLWSARFLETDPEAVIETHLDFLRGSFTENVFFMNKKMVKLKLLVNDF